MRRAGLQAEVLASLALIMAAASAVLAVLLVSHHEASLRRMLARALAYEARSEDPGVQPAVPGTLWWIVAPDGGARGKGGHAVALDAAGRALAADARRTGSGVIRPGSAGEPIGFAIPLDDAGTVAVARVPEEGSALLRGGPGRVALAVLLGNTVVFTVFGASLLRRRLVLPLRRLRDAAERIAAGDWGERAPVDGTRETADLAVAFNTMTAALEGRTEALEKAVADLRAANRDLRRAREGLDQAERLAAVGRLAAGVAHEVGNPMGAILAFLDMARRDPGLSASGRTHLARAVREGERVRRTLRQLLDFSRPETGIPAPVDLARVAAETAALVGAQERYRGLEISVDADPAAPPAHADPRVVTQILLNLVLNAAQAAAGRESPRIRLEISPHARACRRGDRPAAAASRRRFDAVECRVRDNGPGIPDEDRQRIFDPFFTTKDPGEGTGLGLSNALRLAEQSGGTLELANAAPDEGAAFALVLPAPRDPAGPVDVRALETPPA